MKTHQIKTPVRIEKDSESNGWRGLSIIDAEGRNIASVVMQLDDSEVENGKAIVKAINQQIGGAA